MSGIQHYHNNRCHPDAQRKDPQMILLAAAHASCRDRMPHEGSYFTYIEPGRSRTSYAGVTGNQASL